MTVSVIELFWDNERAKGSNGLYTSLAVPYLVIGVSNEDEAISAVISYLASNGKNKISNAVIDNVEFDEAVSATEYKCRANYNCNYSSTSSDEQESVFSFETGGGTKHIDQAIKHVATYPSDATNFNGAINVDEDGKVQGVDIVMPIMNFSETHYLDNKNVTTQYKLALMDATGHINSKAFRGNAVGEVLFLGASGSRRGEHHDDLWEVNFKFAVSRDKKNFKVGDITVEEKKGWDYMWIKYEDGEPDESGSLTKKPKAVYIERVYEECDFGILKLGK